MSKSTLSIHTWCFETLKHIYYIVKLLKQVKMSRNKVKHKKVKIPDLKSGVSKH